MLEEVVPQHFGNISHTHGAPVAGIGFCTASMLRARMALASSLRDIVHSVARLKFGSEKIRVCAGRRRTDGCRPPVFPRPLGPDCAPSGIPLRSWVLVWQNGRGRHKLADHRLFTLLKLFQQVRRWSAGRSPRAPDLLGAAEAAPITMVS